MRIDDASVSREHLVLHVGSTVEVEALGNSNGTQIFPAGPSPHSSSRHQRNGEGLKLIPFER